MQQPPVATSWTPFTQEQLDIVIKDIQTKIREIMISKGAEYAHGTDRIDNFRRNAASLGTSPELVWGVYAAKHWDAIVTYVNDITVGKSRDRSEPIEGRAHDMINYLILFCALVKARGVKVNPATALKKVDPDTHVYISGTGTYYEWETGKTIRNSEAEVRPGGTYTAYNSIEDFITTAGRRK